MAKRIKLTHNAAATGMLSIRDVATGARFMPDNTGMGRNALHRAKAAFIRSKVRRRGPAVLIICTDAFPPGISGGGPAKSTEAIVSALDCDSIHVLTRDRDRGSPEAYAPSEIPKFDAVVSYLDSSGPNSLGLNVLKSLIGKKSTTLYVNSLFSPFLSIVPILLARCHLLVVDRIVIAPRGELMVGAYNIKSWKKRAAVSFMKLVYGWSSIIFHATSAEEATAIREKFPQTEVVTIGPLRRSAKKPLRAEIPGRLLFAGRVSRKKNIHRVIEALSFADRPLELVIAGPLEDARYVRKCREVERSLPTFVNVKWVGTLDRSGVLEEMTMAQVFLHPSMSENFGHSIAEALESGCPVVVGPSTPWSEPIQLASPSPGAIVSPNSAEEIWQATKMLLDRLPDVAEKARETGQAMAANASPDSLVGDYARLLLRPGIDKD